MASYTVGQVLLKFFTPAQFHNLVDGTLLDSKGIGKLFSEMADKSPEQYQKVVSDLTRLGFEISTRQGTSITLKDLVSPVDKDKLWDDFEKFKANVEKSDDPKSIKDKKIFDRYNEMMANLEKDILAKGLSTNKSLAKIVLAGSRGSPSQYRGTIATQGIVVDGEGKPKMDIPIKSSFAEGLSLPEYLATSFGTRSGEVLKKISVAQGGYGSKQFARALMPLQVAEMDCETPNGIIVSTEDNESVGAYLAKPVASYNRNNELT
jgi:DNA-directed RNA polymerase beta' subunit